MVNKRVRQQILKSFNTGKVKSTHLAKPGKSNLILVLDQLKPDFNIGKLFRSAEAFSLCEVHLVGIPFFDPGPSQGCFRKVKSKFFDNFRQCYQELDQRGYQILALSPHADKILHDYCFEAKTALILGHEQFGLSFPPEEYPEIKYLKIQQFGEVESLNVSVAGSISMYEYSRQFSKALVGQDKINTIAP